MTFIQRIVVCWIPTSAFTPEQNPCHQQPQPAIEHIAQPHSHGNVDRVRPQLLYEKCRQSTSTAAIGKSTRVGKLTGFKHLEACRGRKSRVWTTRSLQRWKTETHFLLVEFKTYSANLFAPVWSSTNFEFQGKNSANLTTKDISMNMEFSSNMNPSIDVTHMKLNLMLHGSSVQIKAAT